MIAYERVRFAWAALFSISIILPSLFTISFFERETGNDRLFVRLHLNPSALIQDWTAAEANALITNPNFLEKFAEQIYADEPGPPPRLYTGIWGPEFLSNQGDLVIGDAEASRLDNPRQPSFYQRRLYRRIYICNKSLYAAGPGWRFMQPPPETTSIDPVTGKLSVQCHREGGSNK